MIGLVAPQRAFDAELVADEIQETAPRFVKIVIAHTERQLQRRAGDAALIGDMHVGAKVRAAEIDDAARMRGQAFGALRNRLELRGVAMAGINGCRQIIAGRKLPFVGCADLLLAQRFSCVVQQRVRARLARIRRKLRAREAQGVLHERCFDGVHDERQLRYVVELEADFGVEVVALRVAVIAIAVGLKMRRIHHIIDGAGIAAALERVALSVEAAVLGGAVGLETRLAIFGEDRNDAAGGVAVERRERPRSTSM